MLNIYSHCQCLNDQSGEVHLWLGQRSSSFSYKEPHRNVQKKSAIVDPLTPDAGRTLLSVHFKVTMWQALCHKEKYNRPPCCLSFPESSSSDNMGPGDTEAQAVHGLMGVGWQGWGKWPWVCRNLSLSVTIVLILEKQNETACLGVARALTLREWNELCFEPETCMKTFHDECF